MGTVVSCMLAKPPAVRALVQDPGHAQGMRHVAGKIPSHEVERVPAGGQSAAARHLILIPYR